MRLWAEPTSTICAPPLRPDRNSLSAQRVQIAGPALEEVPHCWDTCFWGGQVLVAEAGQFPEHLRQYAVLEARIDPGGLVQEVILGEVL